MGAITNRSRRSEAFNKRGHYPKSSPIAHYLSLAPVIAFAPSFMVLAAIPFTDKFQFADIGVGLLYYIAISGLTTFGIVTAAGHPIINMPS